MRRALAALCLGGGAAAEVSARALPGRPEVAVALIDELFLGVDPLGAIPEDGDSKLDPDMTHVSAEDIDMVLRLAAQPVTFWLELGSFEGGSAILTARRVRARAGSGGAPRTSIVAVDTFLGDLHCLWNAPPESRVEMLRPDGTVVLYERFRRNVRGAGQGLLPLVLPVQATTLSGLRLFEDLARREVVPRPQVIYLDSAHEKGEVWLELQLAWALLAPGGILFGDDWSEYFEVVKADILLFASSHQDELDDCLARRARPRRTLRRARRGLFLSESNGQWFFKKLPGRWLLNRTRSGVGEFHKYPDAKLIGYNCWTHGFSSTDCCDVERHGRGGNKACWDLLYSFTMCC